MGSRITAVGAAILTLSVGALTGADAAQPRHIFPAHFSAPYLQVQASDAGDMAQDMLRSGDRFYTLAFLIPSGSGSCTPVWEDNRDSLGAFIPQVSALQIAGGQVIVSSGGQSGGELAETCSSTSTLESEYARYLSSYHTNRLDFDIEGKDLNNRTANARRNAALAALQTADPATQVDYTLPVATAGLPQNALALLQNAKSTGVNVRVVNIMIMDYYDGRPVLSDAERSAAATASQLAKLYGISSSQAYTRMGLTPIAGTNDDGAVFSQPNARSLEHLAATRRIQELAFWEVDGYDKSAGYAYSRIFNRILGSARHRAVARAHRPAASRHRRARRPR
jgi:chitinase